MNSGGINTVIPTSKGESSGEAFLREAKMKPCRKCGAEDRFPSGGCKPCSNEQQRLKRIINADSIKANRDRWRKENKEKVDKQRKAWKDANAERYSFLVKRWQDTNKVKVKVKHHARRKFKVVTKHHFRSEDVIRKFVAQGGRCVYCGIDVVNDYHIDHILPVSKGGSNAASNIQILCPTCNQKKHAKLESDFIAEMLV